MKPVAALLLFSLSIQAHAFHRRFWLTTAAIAIGAVSARGSHNKPHAILCANCHRLDLR